jgi:hypothetical protein
VSPVVAKTNFLDRSNGVTVYGGVLFPFFDPCAEEVHELSILEACQVVLDLAYQS